MNSRKVHGWWAAGLLLMATGLATDGADNVGSTPRDLGCAVLIAGGSTAALAAALTAATAAPKSTICLTEPTDTLGGQLAWNPAIDDFESHDAQFHGAEWNSMRAAVSESPSACWVSASCYPPAKLALWVHGRLAALPNLRVFYHTVVRGAARERNGKVASLELVTRSYVGGASGDAEWDHRLSESITDWYSPAESSLFSKAVRNVSAAVIVEATELGDVLATANLPHTLGVEVQPANAPLSRCAQGRRRRQRTALCLARQAER